MQVNCPFKHFSGLRRPKEKLRKMFCLNTTSRFISDPETTSDKIWSILSLKHKLNNVLFAVLSLVRPKNSYMPPNRGEPAPQDRIQQICIYSRTATLPRMRMERTDEFRATAALRTLVFTLYSFPCCNGGAEERFSSSGSSD